MKQFYMNKKFWKEIKKIIPRKKKKGRPRRGTKKIVRAVFYVLKIGIPWKDLPKSFLVSASTVHRRFQEWIQDLVFFKFWKQVLEKYQVKNFEMMRWVGLDGLMSKAPLGGEKAGPSPNDKQK